jgi:hypothetical protein
MLTSNLVVTSRAPSPLKETYFSGSIPVAHPIPANQAQPRHYFFTVFVDVFDRFSNLAAHGAERFLDSALSESNPA